MWFSVEAPLHYKPTAPKVIFGAVLFRCALTYLNASATAAMSFIMDMSSTLA